MKAKTYIDEKYYLFTWTYYIAILALSTIIFMLHVNKMYVVITSILLLVATIYLFFFFIRSYRFDKNKIIIYVGPFKKEIKYHDIKKCYITSNFDVSYATSYKRIAINLGKKVIYISPAKMDDALKIIIDKKNGGK